MFLVQREMFFSFIIRGQIALKKESDGNDNKLIGISNECKTQTVWKLTSVGRLSKKTLESFLFKTEQNNYISIVALVCTVSVISNQSMIVYKNL